MTTSRRPLLVGVALDGTGSHPASWLDAEARPHGLLDARRLVRVVRAAEDLGAAFVTLDDVWSASDADGHVAPRLDALLSLARVAPVTSRIGLVATVPVTHTEPFHVSKNVATLDHVSAGRAGWRPEIATTQAEADLVGRKDAAPVAELVAEAIDVVEVVRRLWDSWEDDAVIRDPATGRYVDRERLHRVDFEGRFFSVRGPSITPRPPQGQPVVVVGVRSSDDPAVELAARQADLVIVEAPSVDQALLVRRSVVRSAAANGRSRDDLRIVVSADVLLEAELADARRARERLDRELMPAPRGIDLVGTAAELTSFIRQVGLAGFDGVHLRPARLHVDLDRLAPVIADLDADAATGLDGDHPTPPTFRARLSLERPANRYAPAVAS